ncbi:hypothetical protein ES703_49228 [subsurface metagenome]
MTPSRLRRSLPRIGRDAAAAAGFFSPSRAAADSVGRRRVRFPARRVVLRLPPSNSPAVCVFPAPLRWPARVAVRACWPARRPGPSPFASFSRSRRLRWPPRSAVPRFAAARQIGASPFASNARHGRQHPSRSTAGPLAPRAAVGGLAAAHKVGRNPPLPRLYPGSSAYRGRCRIQSGGESAGWPPGKSGLRPDVRRPIWASPTRRRPCVPSWPASGQSGTIEPTARRLWGPGDRPGRHAGQDASLRAAGGLAAPQTPRTQQII